LNTKQTYKQTYPPSDIFFISIEISRSHFATYKQFFRNEIGNKAE